MKKRYILTLVLGVIFLSSLFLVNSVKAIGISYGTNVIDNVANGVRKKISVTIKRSDVEGNMLIGIASQGDASTYLEFPKTELVIPAGLRTVEYEFFVAPTAAPNGQHEAFLLFKNLGLVDEVNNFSGSGAIVREAVGMKIFFNVVDKEIKDFSIDDFSFSDVEVGLPLELNFMFTNNGNVNISIDKVSVELIDTTDETHVYKKTFEKNKFPLLSPGSKEIINLQADWQLVQGSYWSKVTIYVDGKVAKIFDKASVDVLPPGSLGQSAEFLSFESDREAYMINDSAEFNARLLNSGDVSMRTVLVAEISKDNNRIDVLRSSEKLLFKKQEGFFSIPFRFEEPGEYVASAYFEYGSSRTPKKDIVIQVSEPKKESFVTLIIVLISISVLFLIFMIIFFKRRHKKDEKTKKKLIVSKKSKIVKTKKNTANKKASNSKKNK